MTIYSTDDEFQNAAHTYFIKNHNNLFKWFKKKTQWTVYYEKNVASVPKKIWSDLNSQIWFELNQISSMIL